jgi:hypothetical protein
MKYKCKCNNIATWDYLPGLDDDVFCDECVPRGCECTHRYVSKDVYNPPLENPDSPKGNEGIEWKWLDENKTHWCFIDEQGREYPCCEFSYDPDGIDVE